MLAPMFIPIACFAICGMAEILSGEWLLGAIFFAATAVSVRLLAEMDRRSSIF